jgi:cell wall-associated NlpC family hydrolase
VAAALLGPTLPAGATAAGTRTPTPAELKRAQQHVAAARRVVADLQARAEHAAEAYNGALVRAQRAQTSSVGAAQRATAAQATYRGSLALAEQAGATARAATAQADAARAARMVAQQRADEAQQTLDRVAVGAFRTDGQMGMLSQLFLANDPLELANARTLMNRVGVYQDKVIEAATRARVAARAAAATAESAEKVAVGASQAASAALAKASAARDRAEASRREASRAAQDAVAATAEAARAKRTALALVARAQARLGSAVRSAAALRAQAEAARRDAAGLDDGTAPSDAARTAIHWAFEEIGVPYSWGGGDENGPTEGFAQGAGTVGFDCSGLTLFIYHKAGIQLDHWTGSQWHVGQRITSRADLLPGDLMFFAYDTGDESTIHHVSIYIGKGKMIEAPYTGEVVRVSSADRPDFIGATRPWV